MSLAMDVGVALLCLKAASLLERPRSALRYLRVALALSILVGDEKNEALVRRHKGYVRVLMAQPALACEEYVAAIRLYTTINHAEGEAEARIGLAHLHRETGRWAPARDEYVAAIHLYSTINHIKGEAEARIGLAHLHRETGRWAPARDEYVAAIHLCTSIDDTKGEADAHFGFGQLQSALGKADLSCAEYEAAVALYSALGDKRSQAEVQLLLAIWKMTSWPLDYRGRELEEVNDIFAAPHQPEHNAVVQITYGLHLQKLGQSSAAKSRYEEALKLLKKSTSKQLRLSVLAFTNHILALHELRAGNAPKAARHQEVAMDAYVASTLVPEAASATIAYSNLAYEHSQMTCDEALHLALPAALYLEGLKFQFLSAPDRIAWSTQATEGRKVVYSLAVEADDTHLIADLIENHLNSVAHAVPRQKNDVLNIRSAFAALHLFGAQTLRPPMHPVIDLHEVNAQGASVLLTTATLPASPPPPLLAPTACRARLVLAGWVARVPNPGEMGTAVRTW